MDAATRTEAGARAPAHAGRRRTAVNRIRRDVPPLATPVWGKRLAAGLGWFSVGLGLVELAAPGRITRWLGPGGNEALVRAYGLREIGAGVGILLGSRLAPLLWGRVAGDALDLATLAAALRGKEANRRNLAIAIGAVAGVTLLDVIDAKWMTETRS